MLKSAPLAAISVATGAGLLACLGYVATQAGSEFDAVRIRNSLIARVGAPADFAWTPDRMPADFRTDGALLPATLRDAATTYATGTTTLDRAVGLAQHLATHPERSAPIEDSTVNAYRAITERGLGWCSDFTQVFIGLATAAGIPVREWGMSFDGYGGHGHAFVEIYSAEHGKWAMLDPFYSWYPVSRRDGTPLSALEFRASLLQADPLTTVEIRRIDPKAFDFRVDQRLVDYYRRGANEFYLWWDNDVIAYDESPLNRLTRPLPLSISQGISIAAGLHPRIRILPLRENAAQRTALGRLGAVMISMGIAVAILSVALAVELVLLRRSRRRRDS